MNRKLKNNLTILAIEIFTIFIFSVIIFIGLGNIFSSFDNSKPENNAHYKFDKSISKNNKTENQLYIVTPGFTYYTDKGAMKLYADIIPINNGNIFVIGEEFHTESYTDMPMDDASIKEELYYKGNNIYINQDNTLTILLTDNSAIFKDNRKVALPFTGELKKINKPITSSNNINQNELDDSKNEEVEEEIETTTEIDSFKVKDIKIDEFSTETTTSGTYVGNKLEEFLSPNYEKKDLSITAKYIETTTNNGTKYQDIYSGKYFYVFGGSYSYDSNICNTVTITGTYRGIEQRFNGLQMDDKYPCFVIKNMRKPTKEEVGE